MKCIQINTHTNTRTQTHTHTKAAQASGSFILENPMLQIKFYRHLHQNTVCSFRIK